MISWFEKYNKLSWSITLIIAIMIFYISSLTFSPGAGKGYDVKPIIYHISAFFFLEFFLLISLIKGKSEKLIPISIIMAILYGISDELHQYFVPGRNLSPSDIFLDAIGISFASLLYFISIKYREIKTSKK